MTITIYIDYKIFNSSEWETISLTPEEYFDKEYFEEYPDDEFEWDSVPQFNHAVDYIDVNLELISHTRIRTFDDKIGASRTLSTAFWNNGENSITERIDKYLGNINELLIVEIKLKNNPPEWEIIRSHRKNGVPILEFHSIISEQENGSPKERIIYPTQC
jgi:hypothetical protein